MCPSCDLLVPREVADPSIPRISLSHTPRLFSLAHRMATTTSIHPSESASRVAPDVIVRGTAAGFLQEVTSGKHQLQADEPVAAGGTDLSPGPYDYLLIALGTCTSMTVGLYARRKQFPLESITVSLFHSRIHAEDCTECETRTGLLDRIDLTLELTGPLTAGQHAKLIEIAGKCPVHRTLKSEIDIRLQGPRAL